MKVKVLDKKSGQLKNALILEANAKDLPSLQEGWDFNFPKLLRNLKNAKAYKLVLEEEPETPLACLIFQMVDGKLPYIAYLELSPQNKRRTKKYDWLAGCLIAFSFQQSLIRGKDHYQGYLELDVGEKKSENEEKLMKVYSSKYRFKRFSQTGMCLSDEDGLLLIKEYLSRS
jgi:hypothetical protein